jgi:FtsZ-interacting cell division protein YlmF
MFEKFAESFKKIRDGKGDEFDVTFRPYQEEDTTPMTPVKTEEPKKVPAAPIVGKAGDDDSNIELKVVRPAGFDEVSDIADYLLDGYTVVLNLELLDAAQTLRMLDFLNGVTYSTDGEIKNVAKSTYIITPHNVDISDDK